MQKKYLLLNLILLLLIVPSGKSRFLRRFKEVKKQRENQDVENQDISHFITFNPNKFFVTDQNLGLSDEDAAVLKDKLASFNYIVLLFPFVVFMTIILFLGVPYILAFLVMAPLRFLVKKKSKIGNEILLPQNDYFGLNQPILAILDAIDEYNVILREETEGKKNNTSPHTLNLSLFNNDQK